MPVPPLVAMAGRLGLARIAKFAWDQALKDPAAQKRLQEQGLQLLRQLAVARRSASRLDRLGTTVEVLRGRAVQLRDEAVDGAGRTRADGWVQRGDRLRAGIEMTRHEHGLARQRMTRQLSRQVGRLRAEVFAATLGVEGDVEPDPEHDPD